MHARSINNERQARGRSRDSPRFAEQMQGLLVQSQTGVQVPAEHKHKLPESVLTWEVDLERVFRFQGNGRVPRYQWAWARVQPEENQQSELPSNKQGTKRR